MVLNKTDHPSEILKEIIEGIQNHLFEISEEESALKMPEKWSKKEILGHLIYSATNNLIRFVKNQKSKELVFDTYDQEQWVNAGNYQNRSWNEVINTWTHFHYHMVHLMANVPEETLIKKLNRHNLDKIAFRHLQKEESTTLLYLMLDYIGHLEHHFLQIIPSYQTVLKSYANEI